VHDGKERVVFYLSRKMLDVETRYPEIEKLCLCLSFTCTRLRHIFLSAETVVICKSDVIKHMYRLLYLKANSEHGCLHCQSSISDTNPRRQSKGKRWQILLQKGSILT
jgi:hypothetical protein